MDSITTPGSIAAIATTATAAVTATLVGPYPDWSVPPLFYEILATLFLGIIATWTREIVRHYDENSMHETSLGKCIIMIIPGMFAGFLGGEIAGMAGYDPSDMRDPSWMFVLTIGYIGPPAMNMLTQMVLGIMQKGLERWGLDFERQQTNNMKRSDDNVNREHEQAVEKDKLEHEAFMEQQNKLLAELKNDPNPVL